MVLSPRTPKPVHHPRISVVIPAYRAAATIGRAVESVLAQTLPASEIVVIDDGSPDDIATALSGYASRIRLLRKRNGGASSARNLGISQSSGEFIAFLDADDLWEPHKLERQAAVFSRHPELAMIASRYRVTWPAQSRVELPAFPVQFLDRLVRAEGSELFDVTVSIPTPSVVVRRSLLGTLRFDESLRTAEDKDLWMRLAAMHPLYICSEPLVMVVLEENSLSRCDADCGYRPLIAVARRYGRLLGPRKLRSVEARVFRGWAAAHLGSGRPGAALSPAWHRVVREPLSPEGWWILMKSAAQAAPMLVRS